MTRARRRPDVAVAGVDLDHFMPNEQFAILSTCSPIFEISVVMQRIRVNVVAAAQTGSGVRWA